MLSVASTAQPNLFAHASLRLHRLPLAGGSEKGIWRLPGGGIYTTAVGYAAGYTPNPTYEECCSGLSGHTEAVQVVYDPSKIALADILRWFWEAHDPVSPATSLARMGSERAP